MGINNLASFLATICMPVLQEMEGKKTILGGLAFCDLDLLFRGKFSGKRTT
jgi:hypothetical protein